MANAEDKTTAKEPLGRPESAETRRPSNASTLLPAYSSKDEPPAGEEPPNYKGLMGPSVEQSINRKGASRNQKKQTSTGHEGSCGMPASAVMGVMGGPEPPKVKLKDRLRGKVEKSPAMPEGGRDLGSSSQFNMWGVPVREFGTFKRKEK